MGKYTKFLAVAMAIVMLVAPFSYAGLQDRSSLIELERNPNNRIKCPEISAPSGDPPSNFGWIYVKDDSGTSDVYYEADDGTVTSLTDSASGVTDTEDVTGANAIAITECGTTYTNTGAVGSVVETLPEASTAIGCEFCFAVTAAQQHNVNPNDGTDQILGLTDAAGDSVQSNAAGDYICVMAVGDDAWAVTQTNNSTNNADGWADAN